MVQIRQYKAGDEKGIISLFNEVFLADRDIEHWHWQFMENPAKEPIIVIAEDNSQIVGQCTLLPIDMMVKGEEVLSSQSIDTMVKKEYRGQGLHIEMANKSYEIGIEDGISFRIGFPSELALRGLLGSIGGSRVTDIPIYMNPYKVDNFILSIVKSRLIAKILSVPVYLLMKIIYREKRIKVKGNYVFREINEFHDDFDKLWDKVKEDSPIMSKRSSKFLNWRITNHPKIHYKTFAAYSDEELEGYIIIKTEGRDLRGKYKSKLGSIVDIVGISEDVIVALYYKAKEYFKEENTDFVVAWATDSMKYRDLFMKLGFFKSRSTIPFVIKDFTQDKKLEDIISQEENWYLMPIESDFY